MSSGDDNDSELEIVEDSNLAYENSSMESFDIENDLEQDEEEETLPSAED
jgi:hypothetical protein